MRPSLQHLGAACALLPALALLPQDVRYYVICMLVRPIVGTGGILSAQQWVDGHPYGPSFANPSEAIARARSYTWGSDDLIIATHPKSGTHLTQLATLLVLYRGALPPKTDLHSLMVLPEFASHGASARQRAYDEPTEQYATHPRVITTHMPVAHLHYSPAAKYVYVMRDPVAGCASGRRMEQLLLGPYLTPPLDVFVAQAAKGAVRAGGWLDQILGWWSVRARRNLLLLRYEWMLAHPRAAAAKLARLAGVRLSRAQRATVVERMSLRWSLEHVDPYIGRAVTPLSPPEQPRVSASNFIVNASRMPAWAQPFSPSHKAHIRATVHAAIRERINVGGEGARHARSFLRQHRRYFCGVDGVSCG